MNEAGSSTGQDEQAVIAAAWSALNQGDLFLALDLVQIGDPATRPRRLIYLEVLARARLGDLDEALDLYRRHDLQSFDDLEAQALGARLLKDQALAGPQIQTQVLAAAADAYEAVFNRFAEAYPLVNAASAALLAGQRQRAADLAARTLAICPAEAETYFDAATRAEALLLKGDIAGARAALAQAATCAGASRSARASTRRQMDLVATALGLGPGERLALLHPLAPHPVVAYDGQAFAHAPALEADIARRVTEALRALKPAAAYGSLSQGADIVIAECILAEGIDLHVVLPFREADVSAHLVGPGWQARYRACLARAASIVHATEGEFVNDPQQLRYGEDVAMGLARIRARQLDGSVVQLVVWDGNPQGPAAGIAVDMALWQATGGTSQAIVPDVPWPAGHADAESQPLADIDGLGPARVVKAILFADFPGFSKLPESLLPHFWGEVMRRIGAVLDRYGSSVVFRNTWGDALYAVIDTAAVAVEIAFDLQAALDQVDRQILRIDSSAQMRIGLHFGPVYRGRDYVTGGLNYYGTEVSRTARIEPITPPGAVYVTEALAAILALEAPDRFASRYVGRLQLAKGYGSQRMYRVTRLSPPG